MRKLFVILALLFAVQAFGQANSCETAAQVSLVGKLRASNGAAINGGILTFTPSATGYIANCGINVAEPVTCGTAVDGSVVGIPDPTWTVVATPSYGSGTLPANTYYFFYTLYDPINAETAPSAEQTVQLSSQGTLTINPPNAGVVASGMVLYIGTTSGGETKQGVTVGNASFVQSTPLVAGNAPPSSNNTACSVVANDAMWPVGTGYVVSLTDAAGNQYPKFQSEWQLNGPGSIIDLSAGLPYYHGVVYYPSPLMASPTNHGQQSISGPLSLGGYNLLSVGKLGIGNSTPGYPLDVTGDINFTGKFRVNGSAGTTGQCFTSNGASTPPSWQTCGSGGGGTVYYQTVQASGTAQTQRAALNFLAPLTVADNVTRTNIGLGTTGVTPGSYNQATITVDSYGRVTAATSNTPATQIVQGMASTSTLCTTSSSSYSTCTSVLTWPVAFADANYYVTCTGQGPSNGGATLDISTFDATTVTVEIHTQRGATATYATAQCIGVHP